MESLLLTSASLCCRFSIRHALFCVFTCLLSLYILFSHLLLNSFDFHTESIIFVKSRLLSLTQHRFIVSQFVTRTCVSWWGNRKEGDHWGDLGIDGWIILGWFSRRWDVSMWTGLGWPRIETGGVRL